MWLDHHRYMALGNDSRAQSQMLSREVNAPASLLGQLTKCLGHAGSLGMYMDQYTREVLQFYMTRDYGAVILYVMKNYNFQVQGFAPMERAV